MIPVVYAKTNSLFLSLMIPLFVGVFAFVAAFSYNILSYKYEQENLKNNFKDESENGEEEN